MGSLFWSDLHFYSAIQFAISSVLEGDGAHNHMRPNMQPWLRITFSFYSKCTIGKIGDNDAHLWPSGINSFCVILFWKITIL